MAKLWMITFSANLGRCAALDAEHPIASGLDDRL
jgi:hypothetical protein